jgi:hypothetical protein
MDVANRYPTPDVYHVELHHHPREWSNGELPTTYKFRVLGKAWGLRWIVHSVYANKPAPPEFRSRHMPVLKALISHNLTELIGSEISQWDNGLLAWEDS